MRNGRARLAFAFALAVVCSLAGTGCGGGSAPEQAAETAGIEEMLELIPDTEESRSLVVITDFATLREALGIVVPTDRDDQTALGVYRRALGGPDPPLIAGAQSGAVRDDTIGFWFPDVALTVEAGGSLGDEYTAIQGSLSAGRIDRALRDCIECLEPETSEYRGVRVYDWGDEIDLANRLAAPIFDELGRGGSVAAWGSFLAHTRSAARTAEMIDASQGIGSLGQDASFRAAAAALSDEGAYLAILSDATLSFEAFRQRLTDIVEWSGLDLDDDVLDLDDEEQFPFGPLGPDGVLLRPYELMGFGRVVASGGSYSIVVLVHATAALAEENLDLFERRLLETSSFAIGVPWIDLLDNYSLDVDGRLLVARFWGALDPIRAWQDGDSLFIHE